MAGGAPQRDALDAEDLSDLHRVVEWCAQTRIDQIYYLDASDRFSAKNGRLDDEE